MDSSKMIHGYEDVGDLEVISMYSTHMQVR